MQKRISDSRLLNYNGWLRVTSVSLTSVCNRSSNQLDSSSNPSSATSSAPSSPAHLQQSNPPSVSATPPPNPSPQGPRNNCFHFPGQSFISFFDTMPKSDTWFSILHVHFYSLVLLQIRISSSSNRLCSHPMRLYSWHWDFLEWCSF